MVAQGLEVELGQLLDGLGGHTGDLGSPGAVFLARAFKIAGAAQVGLVGHVLVNGERPRLVVAEEQVARRLPLLDLVEEGVAVEADEVGADKVLVELVVDEHVVDHGRDEGHVGAGADRDPLVGQRHRGVRQDWVDDHDLGVGVLQMDLGQDVLHGRAAHAGVGRVVAEQDDGLGVDQVGNLVVGPGVAVEQRQLPGDLAGRVVAVVAQITAEAVEQAGKGRVVGCPGLGHRAAELTGAVLDVEGVVTVLLLDGGHGVGDVRDGLVPGDSLVLAFTALGAGNTAQRSLDTRVVVEALTVRAAAHAGAHLVDLVGTEVVAAVVVVAHADHGAVLDVHLERAAAAAVHMAASPDHLVVRELLLVGNLRGVLVGFGIVGEHIARDARPRQRAPGAQHGAHSNKGPTTYIVLRVSHTAPIPSPLLDHGGKGPARACVRISPPPARPSPRAAMAILRTGRPRVGDTISR